MMENYIDINPQDYEKNIFRVFSVERLFEMFENKENVLLKPESWDDPFENFILNIPINGHSTKSSFSKRAYGQCWTLTVESDAIWRIYSPNTNGVKIRTTIRRLFHSLYRYQSAYAINSCFIGRVKYYSKDKIDQLISDRIKGVNQFEGNLGQARTLLFKRYAFKHEKEIRLIYLDPHNESDLKIYTYDFDPFQLIDRITFDPRMSLRLFKIYKNHLLSIGFKGNDKIIQSGLYKRPKFS